MDFKKILNFINPHLEIGGLEISDAYLRFLLIKKNKVETANVDLPPGVIEEGKIKDKEQFFAAVSSLRDKISSVKKKKIYAVVSISDGAVYTETFYVPKSAAFNLDEAAKLNLQMISPIDFSSAYSDWQSIGERAEKNAVQFEILGAFASKQLVDDLSDALIKADFEISAVEFSSFGLVRAIINNGEGFSTSQPYLFLKISSEGLSFSVVKNSHLYFLHSVKWSNVFGEQKKVAIDSLKRILIEEVQKVLSFYETHSGGVMKDLVLVGPSSVSEISGIISSNFPNLKVIVPALRQFKDLPLSWFSVLGTALRGTISRSKDKFISLASAGTEEKFEDFRILTFIRLWRNVVFAVVGGIFLIFLILDLFLINEVSRLENNLKNFPVNPEILKTENLIKEAADFNQKADLIYMAKKEGIAWASFLKNLQGLMGDEIIIKKIAVQSLESPVFLAGEAKSEDAIISLKNRLEDSPYFSNATFQLSDIKATPFGTWGFNIAFHIEKL